MDTNMDFLLPFMSAAGNLVNTDYGDPEWESVT